MIDDRRFQRDMSKRRPANPAKADPASDRGRLRKDVYRLNQILRRELGDVGRGHTRVNLTHMESRVSIVVDGTTENAEAGPLMKGVGNPVKSLVVDCLRRHANQLREAADRIARAKA